MGAWYCIVFGTYMGLGVVGAGTYTFGAVYVWTHRKPLIQPWGSMFKHIHVWAMMICVQTCMNSLRVVYVYRHIK